MRDYCYASLFLRPDQRREVNGLLDSHFNSLREVCHARGVRGNAYVAGSLARGEPSVAAGCAQLTLHSDIDLVIVAPGDRASPVPGLEAELKRRFPVFTDTVFFLAASQVPGRRSAAGHDFARAYPHPLWTEFPLAPPPEFQLDAADLFEVVVYELAGALPASDLPSGGSDDTEYWSRAGEYGILKLLLESLRMAAAAAGLPADGFRCVWEARNAPAIKKIIDSGTLESLLRARESWDARPGQYRRLMGSVVRRTLSVATDVPADDPLVILSAVQRRFCPTGHLAHRFACVLLAAFFARQARQQATRRTLLAWAADWLRAIDPDALGHEMTPLHQELLRTAAPPGVQALESYLGRLRTRYIHVLVEEKSQGRSLRHLRDPARIDTGAIS